MSILSTVILVYAACCAYLFVAQRSFIYFPTAESAAFAADDLRLQVDGATLQLWRVNGGNRDAIIYFGGNAEDVAQNVPDFSTMFAGSTIYLVNYRGYGASDGSPSESTLIADALAVYDHVSETHDRIAVIGRSLGSGIAVQLAASREVSRLVLITPYDSILNVARSAYPIFPVSLLLKDRYDSLSFASEIDKPVLLLIAEHDEFIPFEGSRRLAESMDPALTTFTVIDGAGHNTIQNFPQYTQALTGFLQ
ncbi:MAG: alpha/beta fold hydrolase [Woeseiaceae bacterium]|nr:alpha/beta fold hydrolase [Woeseiaceae bacterium]